MKIYKDKLDAIQYIKTLNHIDENVKVKNIVDNGITKVNDTIIIVDEYNLLD